jgi:hypothetical protein
MNGYVITFAAMPGASLLLILLTFTGLSSCGGGERGRAGEGEGES